MNKKTATLAAMMAYLLLATAGCADTDKPGQPPQTPPTAPGQTTGQPPGPNADPSAPVQVETKIYFPNASGDGLGAAKVRVPAGNKYMEAANALIAGPKDPGLANIFPKGVKVNSVKVEDGLATVDFSEELTHKFVGGSTGEQMLVSSLVNTMTEFPEVARVLITVEGKRIETIAGHLDTGEPFARPIGLVQ